MPSAEPVQLSDRYLGREIGLMRMKSGKEYIEVPSDQEIEDARTARGGWTKETLARWGVPWPPPRGWKKALRKWEKALREVRRD
jgi:hypothetical protein